MNDKPRIGRPKGAGTYRNIGVYGTPAEIAAMLDILTPRQRLEAMLAAIRQPGETDAEAPLCGYCGTRHYGYQDHELA